MSSSYTGVGSRKTPIEIQYMMAHLAVCLGKSEYILRSGGAEGADYAFEYGARTAGVPIEIYRPVNSYRKEPHWITQYSQELWDRASQMAAMSHPAWDRCASFARALHTRNCFQVMGNDLDSPSSFMICWTPDGAVTPGECSIRTGGTGTAIRIAHMNGVEVFNLKRDDHFQRLFDWVKSQGVEHPLQWNK